MEKERNTFPVALGGDALPTRTLAEIRASLGAHLRLAAESCILAGRDLIDAKAQLGHGQWLPFLQEFGLSHSTAANWMRVAREISPESPLAQLPYSKALALLSLPAEEREDAAREMGAQDKSAQEIKRLIEERNRAAEAANAESTRVRELLSQLKGAKDQITELEEERRVTVETIGELQAQVDELSVRPPVEQKIVEVPRDYAELKRKAAQADELVDEAMQAVIASEEKARQAEERLAQMQLSAAGKPAPDGLEAFAAAVNDFIGAAQLFQVNPGPLAARMKEYELIMKRLRGFVIDLGTAVDNAGFEAVGSVV